MGHSYMGHWSNEIIHQLGIGQMESFMNGTLVEWGHSQMGHWSNRVIHEWGICQIGSFISGALVK